MRRSDGLTLIEVLVAVLIVGMVGAFTATFYPAEHPRRREQSQSHSGGCSV